MYKPFVNLTTFIHMLYEIRNNERDLADAPH